MLYPNPKPQPRPVDLQPSKVMPLSEKEFVDCQCREHKRVQRGKSEGSRWELRSRVQVMVV